MYWPAGLVHPFVSLSLCLTTLYRSRLSSCGESLPERTAAGVRVPTSSSHRSRSAVPAEEVRHAPYHSSVVQPRVSLLSVSDFATLRPICQDLADRTLIRCHTSFHLRLYVCRLTVLVYPQGHVLKSVSDACSIACMPTCQWFKDCGEHNF